jgi:SPP1 family predicted phage head-tail adaptor
MIITKLWAKITIQEQSNAVDAIGQPLNTWVNVATVHADVRHLRGLESLRADATASTVKASFRIRHRTGIDAGMRILWGTEIYNIVAVLPQGRREVIDLTCERIGEEQGN